MYRGTAGIDAINQLMQDLLNPQQRGKLALKQLSVTIEQGTRSFT